jgi:transcriptional regulator with XRE-family HTH domain
MTETFEKLMQDDSIRRELGQRIKQLRKDKGWTQKELANRIGTSPAQLNKYEAGQNTPPLDKLVLFAEILTTTADFLIAGNVSENIPISNTRLVQRLQLIDRFDAEEKETIIKLLDGMIAKHNMESTIKTFNDNGKKVG